MPVVAVVNRKGGCGKSTLATHLAAYLSRTGVTVVLGDLDRSRSASNWLRLRQGQALANGSTIQGWAIEADRVLRRQPGASHIVLDTPGGLHGFELARVACHADAIIMPVCNSVFDRDSAAACYAELLTMPRVASGRCPVAAVGMRLDARTQGAAVLQDWAAQRQLPFLGALRETQGYVRCIERGLTLFDLPAARVAADMAQWAPILDWLQPLLRPRPATTVPARPHVPTPPVLKPRPLGTAAAPPGAQPAAALARLPATAPTRMHAPPRGANASEPSLGERLRQAWQDLPLLRLLARSN